MQKMIRVLVVEEWETEDGRPESATLFEAASRDRGQLARFAPVEVAAALGVEAWSLMPQQQVVMSADMPAPGSPGLDRLTLVPEPMTEGPTEKPKRLRRTKAQIKADEDAQAAGFRDAAHQAEVQGANVAQAAEEGSGQGPTGNGDADLATAAAAMQQHANASAAEAGYMTPDGPVTSNGAQVPLVPAALGAPATGVYNPFAPK